MAVKVFVMIVSLLLLLLVIVGCTVAETAVMPTATAVLIVESVNTPTPQPTATSQPTAVPTSTSLPAATNTATVVATDTATPIPSPSVEIYATLISPSENWLAVAERFNDDSTITDMLRVISTNGEDEWVVEVHSGDRMAGIPYPFSWSHGEEVLYFTHKGFLDGCTGFGNGTGMYRADIATGIVEAVVTDKSYWFAISPDETYLAYLAHKRGLILHNLVSSHDIEVPLNVESQHEIINLVIRDLLWSPDSDAILTIASINLCAGLGKTHSVIRVDINTLEQTILINEFETIANIVEWPESKRALVELEQNNFVWVNTITGELTPVEE